MQSVSFRKKVLPHLIISALFLLITAVYFFPVLEGKKLNTHDNIVYLSSAQEIFEHRDKYDEEPLWTNSMFGGMPAYLITTLYPGNLISHIDALLKAFKIPVAAVFLTMLGFYVLLLFYGLNPWIAAAGAIAYSFSSYLFIILGAGHNTKAYAIAYMAPLAGSIIYAYRHHALTGAFFMAWFLTLQIMANHLQITYYILIALIIFGLTELIFVWREKKITSFIKTTAILMAPLAIAVAVNFGTIITTWEYGKYSIRGESELSHPEGVQDNGLTIDYATQWSYGIDETMTLLIPNYKGGASKPLTTETETFRVLRQNDMPHVINQLQSYWGSQPVTSGPVYVGAVVFFLFVLGLFILKGRDKWWLLIATILSIMLAWGKNFMPLTELFMNIVPGYNKFRAVSMTLVIAGFTIPLLGFLALHALLAGKIARVELLKGLKRSTAVVGGVLLLFSLFPGIAGSFISESEYTQQIPPWLINALAADRRELLQSDAFRALIFVLLTATLLFMFLKEKISLKLFIPAIIILLLIDMWPVNKRYMDSEMFVYPNEFNKNFKPSPADEMIIEDTGYYRVLNLAVSPFNDASTSVHHMSVGGYHGAKLRRYQELIDSVMIFEIQNFRSALQTIETIEETEILLEKPVALNMLNTRYIIYNPQAPPLNNPHALGSAWFADTIIFVDNSNEEIEAVADIDPRTEAIVANQFRSPETELSPADGNNTDDTIELVSYKANELVYRSVTRSERLAIFSEVYYPAGWKAYINDKEVDYIRANYLLRALPVPEGESVIRFVFQPSSYDTGNRVAMTGSFILLIVTAVYGAIIIRNRINKRKEQ